MMIRSAEAASRAAISFNWGIQNSFTSQIWCVSSQFSPRCLDTVRQNSWTRAPVGGIFIDCYNGHSLGFFPSAKRAKLWDCRFHKKKTGLSIQSSACNEDESRTTLHQGVHPYRIQG